MANTVKKEIKKEVELKEEVSTPKVKHSKVALTEMTAKEFVGIIGENCMFWASRRFKDTDVKKAHEWSDIFLSEGAIDKKPEILG